MSRDLQIFEKFTELPPELQSSIFEGSNVTKHAPLLSKVLRDTLKNTIISEYIQNKPTRKEINAYILTRPVSIVILNVQSRDYDPTDDVVEDEDDVLGYVTTFATDNYPKAIPVGLTFVGVDVNGLFIHEGGYKDEKLVDVSSKINAEYDGSELYFDVMTMKYVIGKRLEQFSIMNPIHHTLEYFNYVIDGLKTRAPLPVLYLYVRENARMLFIPLTADELEETIDTKVFQDAIERLYPLIINRLKNMTD